MTKDKLWLLYLEKNPSFIVPDAKVNLDSRGLKKFFDLTYDQGVTEGYYRARNEKSIFESIFGQ
jgi:hypothetical protein